MLSLHILASSGVPVYLQIEQQIRQSLASGLLRPDEALIRTVPGAGTFVGSLTAPGSGLLKAEKFRRIRPLVDQLAIEAAQLCLGPDDVHKLLDSAIDDLARRSRTATRSSGEDK
jgi:GntR family transcriptional regulator